MTVSLFSEVAHHPTSLWVSVAKTAYTHTLLQQQPEFSLAVLNEKQEQIAITCGTISGRDSDKTIGLQLYSKSDGFLFLSGALASTSCRLRSSFACDDHTVFIADILEADLESRTSHLRQLLMSDLKK
jgi:flavin reductase (DIM6/NTAB) family NADH-FMN oxidoreductase RutF